MTVGQEFYAFAASLDARSSCCGREKYLYAENMGATAIGTGINVPKGYPEKRARELAKLTGKPSSWPRHDRRHVGAAGFRVYSSRSRAWRSSSPRSRATLILLARGPRAGLAEINLPPSSPVHPSCPAR
jgi:aspartate ammonia-lyase